MELRDVLNTFVFNVNFSVLYRSRTDINNTTDRVFMYLEGCGTYRDIVEEETETGCWFRRWWSAICTQSISWLIAVMFRVDYWRAFRQCCNTNTMTHHDDHITSTLWGCNPLMQRNLMSGNQDPETTLIQWNYWHGPPLNIIFAANFVEDRGAASVCTYQLVLIQLLKILVRLGHRSKLTHLVKFKSVINVSITDEANCFSS